MSCVIVIVQSSVSRSFFVFTTFDLRDSKDGAAGLPRQLRKIPSWPEAIALGNVLGRLYYHDNLSTVLGDGVEEIVSCRDNVMRANYLWSSVVTVIET